MFTEILILMILILLNAFFAASEIALISLNDNKIKAMAESGHKKARLLHNLLSEPSRFLATIQIGITLAGFLASAFAAQSFASEIAMMLYEAGVPIALGVLESIAVIVITLILSYFTLVLGELVPKRLAMKKSEPIAMFVALPLTILLKIAAPFVKLLTNSTNLIVRLFGVDPYDNKEEITEEEIRMMVDVGNENGTIQETEKMVINNIFEFDNKTVDDIMTHRSAVVSIPIDLSLQEVVKIINIEKYSRYPIYVDDADHIEGILHVKDMFQFMDASVSSENDFALKDIIRKPYFIPASKHIDDLYKEMQKDKVYMAVAIDEYGDMAGIVTIEDLVEEIVGNIFDEHDEEEKSIEQLDEDTFLINGGTNLRDLKDYLDVEFPLDEYDTLSGFLIGLLDRIPNEDEQPVMEYSGFHFKVENVDDMRITAVKVSRSEPLDTPEAL
ncbi:hemolysin family protein [Paenibacillus marinisediminis]